MKNAARSLSPHAAAGRRGVLPAPLRPLLAHPNRSRRDGGRSIGYRPRNARSNLAAVTGAPLMMHKPRAIDFACSRQSSQAHRGA